MSIAWLTLGVDRAIAPVLKGSRKNLFDLRRTAVVHNLHVIAKIVAQAEKQIAASGG